jgi:transposase
MGRKCIAVKSLYNVTIEDLNIIANNSKSNYTRDVLKAVIMRYNGVHPQLIADSLSKSRTTAISYINDWNNMGIACISDYRGNNVPSSLTNEITENIRDAVTNKSPHDFGYEQNRWNSKVLSRYIEETYGNKYCTAWITKMLKNLGFSYKRGVYKPTLANPELQESFKKKCQSYWI